MSRNNLSVSDRPHTEAYITLYRNYRMNMPRLILRETGWADDIRWLYSTRTLSEIIVNAAVLVGFKGN